jgi:hypothetical protein
MTIKVIVELKAHPGRRDELRTVLESMLAAPPPAWVPRKQPLREAR